MAKTKQSAKDEKAERDPRTAGYRETVESLVVAIILALLFRAFVAEAFVIPTGSMAPTLMGAHKDIFCPQCRTQYPTGASVEARDGQSRTVVGTVCPNCRYIHSLDLAGAPNETTFGGDRILVSKFSYALQDPRRWDVIVFKYPGNPKQNYIKRLVGLPNETLRIHHGDVYARPAESDRFTILRKPPDKVLALSHPVDDTDHLPSALLQAGWPTPWQPWQQGATAPPTDSWQIDTSGPGMTAQLAAAADDSRLHWMRYFHRWASPQQWSEVEAGLPLRNVDPYDSRPITDFYSYNGYLTVPTSRVYTEPPRHDPQGFRGRLGRLRHFFRTSEQFSPEYDSGGDVLRQFGASLSIGSTGTALDGVHWVGDLILEADVQLGEPAADAEAGLLVLELVEAAVQYRCTISPADGTARLEILDVDQAAPFLAVDGTEHLTPTAATSIRWGSRHKLRFANVDDQLLLWVDGRVIAFDGPTTFDSSQLRTEEEHRPFYTPEHPLDGAPLALGLQGGSATVHRLAVRRDQYYIATQGSANGIHDYDAGGIEEIQAAVGDRSLWDDLTLWQARRTVEFPLDEDQFFPMGDNSPESLDARAWAMSPRQAAQLQAQEFPYDGDAYLWADAGYVPRDLLVGKAILVFWPHTWRRPIPFLPNVRRMGLIR